MCPVALDSIRRPVSATIQDLLYQSPLYTDECDLHPGSMRRVVNRDPTVAFVTQELREHIDAQPPRSRSSSSISADLDLHPGAARALQLAHLSYSA
ncbi:hypothetical protein GGH96_001295 [Coemansia sp. RSA 1972]|nr:hypothetical protein GGH96_001295 [Coemansia sp. RSA 1972]